MSDMLQLVVNMGNSQCATLRLECCQSRLSVANLDDKLKEALIKLNLGLSSSAREVFAVFEFP
jgi:hypothetical protein